jgi:nitroimidazol reductase NimA-like FMN-containing flavoprotein (pyridoxamine 5'-phosphate oxidase superfamily)
MLGVVIASSEADSRAAEAVEQHHAEMSGALGSRTEATVAAASGSEARVAERGRIELTYRQCLELLRDAEVGRAAMWTPAGPMIWPVNYTVVGSAIVFRTTPYSALGRDAWHSPLAFEVDGIDKKHRRGWSVVATGRGELVEDQEREDIKLMADPQPWAKGRRPLYIRLPLGRLTGFLVG